MRESPSQGNGITPRLVDLNMISGKFFHVSFSIRRNINKCCTKFLKCWNILEHKGALALLVTKMALKMNLHHNK